MTTSSNALSTLSYYTSNGYDLVVFHDHACGDITAFTVTPVVAAKFVRYLSGELPLDESNENGWWSVRGEPLGELPGEGMELLAIVVERSSVEMYEIEDAKEFAARMAFFGVSAPSWEIQSPQLDEVDATLAEMRVASSETPVWTQGEAEDLAARELRELGYADSKGNVNVDITAVAS